MKSLYDEKSLEIMHAAEVCSMRENRVEQIRSYALSAGVKRIGIANCFMFATETQIITDYLSRDFAVFSVDCKYGGLGRGELLGGSGRGVICNPAGQADFLNRKNTDLNISLALCVGHDMVFNRKSKAPVTTMFTKDFTNNNDPARAVDEISRLDS